MQTSFISNLANAVMAGLSLIENRLALIAVETEQQSRLLITLIVLAISTMLALGFALFFLCALIIIAFWDNHRLLATGLVTLFFATLALVTFSAFKHLRRTRPKWLSSSINEIAKDIAAIRDGAQ